MINHKKRSREGFEGDRAHCELKAVKVRKADSFSSATLVMSPKASWVCLDRFLKYRP